MIRVVLVAEIVIVAFAVGMIVGSIIGVRQFEKAYLKERERLRSLREQ